MGRMGGRSPEVQDMLSQAMLTARQMGQEDKFTKAVFDYIHKHQGNISTKKDLSNLLTVNGLPEAEFGKLFDAQPSADMLAKNNKYVADRAKFITGVPTFIVNDKYLVKFSRDMSLQDRFDLINWLTGLN